MEKVTKSSAIKIKFISLFLILIGSSAYAQDPAYDDFERSGGLGSNWTIYFGAPNVTIIFDSDLGISGGSFGIAAWTGSVFNADQYSEAIISPNKIDSMWAQVFARRRTSDFARYAFHWSDRDGDTIGVWDIKYDGVPTSQTRFLATLAGPPPLPGDTIRVEVITNPNGYPVITGYLNGNFILSAVDTASVRIMNGEPGMAFRFRIGFPQTYPQQIFEEWRGGSLTTPTGINQNEGVSGFYIYPNPATNEFYVKGDVTLPAVMEIYDVTGKKLLSENITSNNQKINVAGLAKGMYFVKIISTDNKQTNVKILIE